MAETESNPNPLSCLVFVEDRQYRKFNLTKEKVEQPIPEGFDPLSEKLFDQDEISIQRKDPSTGDLKISLIHSPVRQHRSIPGVLILANKKTYGRIGKKMLYQCQPDDKHLPTFLVPYQVKQKFSKNPVNKYVTFEFVKWSDKHPEGKLTNTLGSVDDLPSFYEYQLYCKSLNASIQNFTRDAAQALKKKTEEEFIEMILNKYPSIHNKLKSDTKVFAIDPKHSRDYDDAFDIEIISDNEYKICIYISNVPLWMEVLNLWDSFSNRVSTIYLPDKRRPMLPTCLSECLCSLVENQIRFAFTCELHIVNDEIVNKTYYNSAIRVFKNFRYDDSCLGGFLPYQQLFERVITLTNKYKAISIVRNSHDIVGYLMILMNHFTGNEMIHHKNGIYRSATINDCAEIPSHLSKEATSFLQIWNSNGGNYVAYSDEIIRHEIIKLDNYVHITSPIRRLVDLINMIQFQINTGMMDFGDKAIEFMNKWMRKLEYINKTTRAVRKVQCDCSLLDLLSSNSELYHRSHKGVVFDKIKRNDGYYQYGVYLYELKMVSRIKALDEIDNYSERDFNIYMFTGEGSFKKKIKLQLVSD